MQYRTLGKTGLDVSLVGMGCMRFPFVDGDCNKGVDLQSAFELLQYAADNGVNYFDTAYGYHGTNSEAILGEALESRRKNLIFTTKQPWWIMSDDYSIRANLENTLKKLRTDYIDCYLLHRIIPEEWENIKKREILKHFENFKREGLIRHIGFSYHGDYETFKRVATEYPWEMCMVQQNMLDIDIEVTAAGLEFAGELGLGVTIMEPLRGGGLAFAPPPVQTVYEKYERETKNGFETNAKDTQTVYRCRPPQEWAFRHLADSPAVSSIVSGMSSMAQLVENIAMFSQEDMKPGCLSPAEKETISAARAAYKSIVSIPCTTCDYCVPCPVGVQIPGIFSLYNEFKMFEQTDNPRRNYMFTTRAGGDASKCTNCGVCIKKCPQNINIPQALQTAHETLQGWVE